CAGLVSCREENNDSSSNSSNQGEYVVWYYFENDDGAFVHDESKDETGAQEIGSTVSIDTPKAFDGYYFDEENANNKTLDVVREGVIVKLKLYYKKGVAPEPSDPETPDNPDNPDNPDTPDVPDVPDVPMVEGALCVYNSNYVKPTGQEVKATLSVSNPSALQGVVTLYNTEETVNSYGAKESYYLFATQGAKAVLYIYWGGEFLEVKSADITAVSAGNHEYKIVVNTDGTIVCSLDSNVVLNVAVSDFSSKGYGALNTAGRAGVYGDENASVTVVAGGMTFDEVKVHFKTVLGKISTNYYIFNDKLSNEHPQYSIDKRNDEIPFAWINGFGTQAQELIDQIDGAKSVASLVEVAKNNEARKIAALKQQIKSAFGSYIQVYQNSLLLPMVSASSEPVTILDTGKTISLNVFEADQRWWVPNAYMLYSGWGDGDYKYGIMEMLELEVDACNNYETLYNISDKYICDVTRALSYRCIEYYYFYQYNQDPGSVYPVFDWHLYTYYDGANSTKFQYCGQVFASDYSWPMAYRLNKVFFDPTADGFKTTPQAIMNDFTWVISRQVLADQDYNTVPGQANALTYSVVLNANGGTLDNYTLTGNVHQNLELPTPTKSGATFGGWYLNNAYEGTALAQIAATSNRKDITLYAK
ncbi:MAG: InlB B-repeat-containing protein, partial [Clostridia bacterium]|nr:InlB B-repeat-containing protein [Clostridia bacterium]